MIALVVFVSCSENDEPIQVETNKDDMSFKAELVIDEFVNSYYYVNKIGSNYSFDFDNYQYEELSGIKYFTFKSKDKIHQDITLVGLLNEENKIDRALTVSFSKKFSKDYTGDLTVDFLNENTFELKFKEGRYIDPNLNRNIPAIKINEDPSIDGDDIDPNIGDGDETSESGFCHIPRRKEICVGNTIANMSTTEAILCGLGAGGCAARIVIGCLVEGCPYDGVGPWPF